MFHIIFCANYSKILSTICTDIHDFLTASQQQNYIQTIGFAVVQCLI